MTFKLSAASSRRASPSSRVLPSNTYPAATTAEPSHGLPLPSALEESEVHSSRAKPARYVPPSGFGYPLDGLLPRIPCRFCFAPAALVGFTLRRFPLPRGFQAFQPGRTHIPLARRYFRHRSVRPARRASVAGFAPLGIALQSRGGLGRRPLAPPLGFAPLGSDCESLAPDLSGPPLACLARPRDYSRSQPAPQSVNRPSLYLAQPIPEYRLAEATLLGFLHRPAPEHSD